MASAGPSTQKANMSTQQPEALRLADAMDAVNTNNADSLLVQMAARSAAAELRRLHALCEEMGEALDEMLTKFTKAQSTLKESEARIKAHAALTKWKESK